MVNTLTIQLWLLAFLLGLSAFFSGVEAAFLALTNIELRQMLDNKRRWAKVVAKLKDEPHKLVITILIGNNLANIAASTIAAAIAIELFQSNALGISTGIMTLLVLIFGEITPKTLAIGHRSMVTRIAAWPLMILRSILYPFIKLLDIFTQFISKLFGASTDEIVTEEEIRSVVSLGEESGTIEKDERWMINNILKLDEIEVEEVMTPRVDIFYVGHNSKLSDISESIIQSGKSRIPVFKNDAVVGVLFLKDLFDYVNKGQTDVKVSKVMRKPLFIPEQKKIDELLKLFQKKKLHIGIVVDEHGSVSGLVTIEDILEEIVGEIFDETDKKWVMIKKIDNRNYHIKGGARIDKINEKTGLNLKESEEYDTVSGFILKKLGRIPNVGEKVEYKKFIIEIIKADNKRIKEVKVEKK